MKTGINDETMLYRCVCGEFSFLEVWFDGDFYYFMITAYPKTLWQKLQAIWMVIKGIKYEISSDILLSPEDAKELGEFLMEKDGTSK